MRGLGYAIGIFGLLVSSVAYSEDVRLGSSVVNVSAPRGYCALDETNKTDVQYVDAISNFARVAGFSLVAAYADCHELTEARKSDTFITNKFAITKWNKRAGGQPSQFIAAACDQVRRSGLSDEQKARASQYVTEFSKGNSSLKDVLSLGILDEIKGTVCYSAKLIRGKIANGGNVTLVYVNAMTSVGDQPIMMGLWTSFADETSIAAALASLKKMYSDFAAGIGKAN